MFLPRFGVNVEPRAWALAGFAQNEGSGKVKCWGLDFFRAREGLGCFGPDPYRPGDAKNPIILPFRTIGGQFGSIFLILPIIWGSPLGPLFFPIGPLGPYGAGGGGEAFR